MTESALLCVGFFTLRPPTNKDQRIYQRKDTSFEQLTSQSCKCTLRNHPPPTRFVNLHFSLMLPSSLC